MKIMSTLRILSVAESNYISDGVVAQQNNYRPVTRSGSSGPFGNDNILKIKIDKDRKLDISLSTGEHIKFLDLDVDGLIQYLQEVKVWLSEEDLVRKLMGN